MYILYYSIQEPILYKSANHFSRLAIYSSYKTHVGNLTPPIQQSAPAVFRDTFACLEPAKVAYLSILGWLLAAWTLLFSCWLFSKSRSPNLTIVGTAKINPSQNKLPTTTCFSQGDIFNPAVLPFFDLYSTQFSTTHHCSLSKTHFYLLFDYLSLPSIDLLLVTCTFYLWQIALP